MKKKNYGLTLALVLLLISLFSWGYQLKNGLIVTGMRNSFSWGLYIGTFAFFVGIAAGGLIVSSSVYLFGIKQLKPFTRIASLSAFASILGAAAMIMADLGRVDRIYNLILHPNFRSPLVWDVIVVTVYMVLTFLSVYFQLLPDWQRDGRGFFNGWTREFTFQQIDILSAKWSRRISIVGLPVAILIHTVTALLFAVQASRGWWNTATLPPDFIAMAVASGAALVLVISLIQVGNENFYKYQDGFKTMAYIVAGSLVVHFFLLYTDFLVRWWWGKPEELKILSLVFNRYGWIHLLEVVLPAFTMLFFFTSKAEKSYTSLMFGSLLLFIGVFAHRMLLMFPAFNAFPLSLTLPGMNVDGWSYPVAIGQFKEGLPVFVSSWSYSPTLVEVGVALLPFGLAMLVISLMLKSYNFLVEKQ